MSDVASNRDLPVLNESPPTLARVPGARREEVRATLRRVDPLDAARYLKDLASEYPEDSWIHLELGRVQCLLLGEYESAAQSFFNAARLRAPVGLLFLGLQYATGKGVTRNMDRAERLMETARKLGVPQADLAMERYLGKPPHRKFLESPLRTVPKQRQDTTDSSMSGPSYVSNGDSAGTLRTVAPASASGPSRRDVSQGFGSSLSEVSALNLASVPRETESGVAPSI